MTTVPTRHDPTAHAPIVLAIITVHETAIRAGGIVIMVISVREGKVMVKVKATDLRQVESRIQGQM